MLRKSAAEVLREGILQGLLRKGITMKCTYGKAVQWKDGEADLTGVLVLDADDGWLITQYGGVTKESDVDFDERVLVAHGCTRELEFVGFGNLSDYPSEAIEEPNCGGSGSRG
jgi:hypothetical protein